MPKSPLRALFSLAALVPLLLSAACDDATGPERSVAGSYTLEQVDGRALPWAETDDAEEKLELLGFTMELRDDNTLEASLTWRETDKTTGEVIQDTETVGGTYTGSGSALSLVFEGGDAATATLSGGTLTLRIDETTFTFRRR